MNKNLIFDAHTHFNDETYEKEGYFVQDLIQEAQYSRVGYFLNCAFDIQSSIKALEQARDYQNMWVAVGIHPMDVHKYSAADLKTIDCLASEQKVVAIGEVGLDYYWKKDTRKEQIEWFEQQIALAKKHNLTLMMHIRDEKNLCQAYDDVLEIIKKHHLPKMVVHCFSANAEYAQKFLDLGCYINIGGAVTFKNAKELKEAVKVIPLERMLVETDAPYLAPHPFRGQRNFPKLITYTVAEIAKIKGVDFNEVVEKTTTNAFELFNLV